MPSTPDDPKSPMPEEEKNDILIAAYKNIKIIFDTNFSDFCFNVAGRDNDRERKLKKLLRLIYVYSRKQSIQKILYDDNIILILFMLNRVYEIYKSEPSILISGADDTKNFLEELNRLPEEILDKIQISYIYNISKYIDNLHEKIAEYEMKVNELKTEFDSISVQWNLSSFAKTFQDIEEEERQGKIAWLIGASLSMIAAFSFVLWNVYVLASTNFQVDIEQIVLRVATTFFLYIIAYWFGKRYYICRTQEISYRHMAAVLKVYNVFKDSVNSENEKNIIMSEMAHTVFRQPIIPTLKLHQDTELVKMLDLVNIITKK